MSGGRTIPCSGMAVVRVLTWLLFPRHPLMGVVRLLQERSLMADEDDLLAELTGKGQYIDDFQRIYETICKQNDPNKKPTQIDRRIIFVLATVISKLIEQNLITQEELDQMLYESL